MYKQIILVFLLFFFSNSILAQIDSNKVFKASKGTWKYPIEKIDKIDTTYNSEYSSDIKLSFLSDSSYPVKAVYEGYVQNSIQVEDIFVVIIKFGNYFVSYVNLDAPLIHKGDYIKAGQTIAYLSKDISEEFRLDIYLSYYHKQLDPYPWFKINTQ